jgi:hypothetical protein
MIAACSDQQPTGPEIRPVARDLNVSYNKFFVAWSETFSASPIQTQLFALDTRQNRQFSPFVANESVLAFARANPGRLYINGDEIDQYCVAPSEYAVMYHDFVAAILSADPTARVSPSGLAEPNDHCCPVEGEPCRSNMHSISYAENFYNAYIQRYGVAPRVDEWRFHDFGVFTPPGDIAAWWERIDREAAWSIAHGAKMVLGSFGFISWSEPESQYIEHLKQALGRIMNDPRIVEAVYWSNEPMIYATHFLTNPDGSLTAAGRTYANPLTDIPAGVSAAGSDDGSARLQWNNTTYAWGAEVEFWVQSPGSSSFVYNRTERVPGPGAVQTSEIAFTNGDNVKGRVRYYNVFGQAGWSDFSNAVSIEGGKARASGAGTLPCFSSKRIQSQPCG